MCTVALALRAVVRAGRRVRRGRRVDDAVAHALQIASRLALSDSYYDGAPLHRANKRFRIRTWKGSINLSKAWPRGIEMWTRHWLNESACQHTPSQASFSVATAHIRGRARSFYQGLLAQFHDCSRCEATHYIERVWPLVFSGVESSVSEALRCR